MFQTILNEIKNNFKKRTIIKYSQNEGYLEYKVNDEINFIVRIIPFYYNKNYECEVVYIFWWNGIEKMIMLCKLCKLLIKQIKFRIIY